MPNAIADIFGSVGSGVSDIFGGIGDQKAAKGYNKAAVYAQLNARIAEDSTKLQMVQADRQIYQTLGGQQADIGGAGLANSGSALDLVRSSAMEGSLSKQLIAYQGLITANGYKAEAESYLAQAQAMKASAKGKKASGVGKLIGAAATAFAIFSDDRLKTDVKLVRRRPDGLGIYTFRYHGEPETFEGVMASEVRDVCPAAVHRDKATGLDKVDYDMIGVIPRVLEAA